MWNSLLGAYYINHSSTNLVIQIPSFENLIEINTTLLIICKEEIVFFFFPPQVLTIESVTTKVMVMHDDQAS